MSDFESSDYDEIDTVNPHAHRGQQSIEQFLDNALEDRRQSKTWQKNQSLVSTAPTSDARYALWWNRYSTFQTVTLDKEITFTPNGAMIERFLVSIVQYVVPRNPVGVPSVKWMARGLVALLTILVFRFPKFQLSAYERSHIKTTVVRLHREGKLTTSPAREKKWLGVYFIRLFANAMLNDALKNGTRSWDVLWSRLTSLVLLSAIAGRSGEVALSQGYDELHIMTWSDIRMIVLPAAAGEATTGPPLIRAEITLRFQKGEKDNQFETRVEIFKIRLDNESNTLDVVKALLIQALRAGYTYGKAVEEVIEDAYVNNNRRIRWTPPALKRPVISSINTTGTLLIREKPAPTGQISISTKKGALAAGVLASVTAYDVRRGAARDTAYAERSSRRAATEVAPALGHRPKTAGSGTTDMYIGPSKDDNWSKRIDAIDRNDPILDRVEVARTSLKRKTKLSAAELTQWCIDNGKEPDDQKARALAGRKLRKIEEENLFEQGKASLRRPSGQLRAERSDLVTLPFTTNDPRKVLADKSGNLIVDPRLLAISKETTIDGSSSVSSRQDMSGNSAADMLFVDDGQHGLGATAGDDGEYDGEGADVDPSHLQALENALTGSAATVEDNLLLAGLVEIQTVEILTADAEKYFSFFSKINVACFSKYRGGSGDPSVDYGGGSKDPMSRFQHKCANNKFGCPFQTPRADALSTHFKTCNYVSVDAVPSCVDQALKCPFYDDCGKSYQFQSRLNLHLEQAHKQPRAWTPKACGVKDCPEETTLWQTKTAFHEHTRKRHSKWKPTKCTYPSCTRSTVYQQAGSIVRHLRDAHGLKGKAATEQYVFPAAQQQQDGSDDEE